MVSSINVTEDWFVGGSTHTFVNIPKTGLPLRIFWQGNARISTLMDENADDNFRVEALLGVDTTNLFSPSASILPIINVAYPLADASFLLPAADTDGDTLTWTIAPNVRSSLTKAAPDGSDDILPFTLSIEPTTGLVHWATNQEVPPAPFQELYAVQFLVNDGRGGEIPVDALLRLVQNAGLPPVATINGSQTPYETDVNPGTPVTFTFCGDDPDFGATVTLTSGGLPTGASMNPALPFSGTPPRCSQFNWTPNASQAGSHVISFAVTDNFAQQDTISATIFVRTNSQPAITCPAPVSIEATSASGASYTAESTVSDPDGDTVDVRWLVDGTLEETDSVPGGGPLTVDFTHTYSIGSHSLVIEARDGITAVRTCNTTVTVTDGFPIVTVPADMIVEATSAAGATVVYNPTPTATDVVDGTLPVTCTPPDGSVFALGGPHTVSCSATDSAGQTTTETFRVTVVDTTPPVVEQHDNMIVEATSAAGAVVNYTVNATDTVDPNPVVTCVPPSGSQFALGGPHTVSCTAVDDAGNVSTPPMTFTVTVVDTTPPVVEQHENMVVEATSANGAIVTFTVNATDTVDPNPVVTCTPASGSQFALGGPHTVSCTAVDDAGNVSAPPMTFTVTVVDTTPPVVEQHENMIVEATDANGAIVNFTVNATDTVDPNPVVTCTPPSGSRFALGGPHTVSCTAVDDSGNTSDPMTFTVTVVDSRPPVVAQHPDITREATGPGGAVVTFTVTATDDVDPNPVVTCTPASGSMFPIQPNTVSCTAEDDAGNTSAPMTFRVFVVDTTPPVISNMPGNMTVPATTPAGAIVTWPSPTAFDLVDLDRPVTCIPPSGSLFVRGTTTTVTCSASDTRGNTSSRTFTVTVTAGDTKPPDVCLELNPGKLWPPNHKMRTIDVKIVVTDNEDTRPVCRIASVTSSEPVTGPRWGNTSPDWMFSGVDLQLRAERYSREGRTYTVTATCTDDAGNVGTATAQVRVPHDQGHGNGDDLSDLNGGGSTRSCCRPRHHDDDRPAPAGDAPELASRAPEATDLSGEVQNHKQHHPLPPPPACPIYDAKPPVVCISLRPAKLWPANNLMRNIQVSVNATDNQDRNPSCRVSSVTSTEPVTGPNHGNTTPDWTFNNLSLQLRAERFSSSGRTYTVTVACTDDWDNVGTATATVHVPRYGGGHFDDNSESSSRCCNRGDDVFGLANKGGDHGCDGQDDRDDLTAPIVQ